MAQDKKVAAAAVGVAAMAAAAAASMVDIYYIGLKPLKKDNILWDRTRQWHGFGDCVSVPATDAPKYLYYKMVWADRAGYEAALKEREKQVAGLSAKGEAQPPAADKGAPTSDDDLDERRQIIMGAILQLEKDNPKDYADGRPVVARIVTLAGFNPSLDEINEALNELRAAGKVS